MKKPTAFLTMVFVLIGVSRLEGAEPVPDASITDPSCACVAQGKRWAQGEEVCLAGLRMVCGMEQNVTTWKSLGQSCQVSHMQQSQNPLTAM